MSLFDLNVMRDSLYPECENNILDEAKFKMSKSSQFYVYDGTIQNVIDKQLYKVMATNFERLIFQY